MTFYLVEHHSNSLQSRPNFLMSFYLVKHRYSNPQSHPNFQIPRTSQNPSHSNQSSQLKLKSQNIPHEQQQPQQNQASKELKSFFKACTVRSDQRQIRDPESSLGTEIIVSPSSISEQSDLDLPIAIRKGTRKCTQHPVSDFVSLNRLSHQDKNLPTALDSIIPPKTVQETLRNKKSGHEP